MEDLNRPGRLTKKVSRRDITAGAQRRYKPEKTDVDTQ